MQSPRPPPLWTQDLPWSGTPGDPPTSTPKSAKQGLRATKAAPFTFIPLGWGQRHGQLQFVVFNPECTLASAPPSAGLC